MVALEPVGHVLRLVAQLPIIAACAVASLLQPLVDAAFGAPAPVEGDLRGKVALVTGATAGVGFATARRHVWRLCGAGLRRRRRAQMPWRPRPR